LDVVDLGQSGSPIWKLIRASVSLIQNHLRWNPGNGKEIKIWEDHFSEKGVLSSIPALDQFRLWLTSIGKIHPL
jgi:hypothetical protein